MSDIKGIINYTHNIRGIDRYGEERSFIISEEAYSNLENEDTVVLLCYEHSDRVVPYSFN